MRVLVCTPPSEVREWHAALAAALPEAAVRVWEPGLDWRADYAVLSRAPPAVLQGQPALRAVFNLGAGVEGLLAHPALPREVPIVRLEDAGMARQMVEYVSWAVLRYFRRLDLYAAQQSRAEWRVHPALAHADFAVGVMGLGVLGAPVARALSRLGFPVRGWSRGPQEIAGVQAFAGREALAAFLGGTRALVCMLPHTSATAGILDRRALAALPPGAYLINVGRGALVVDEDLFAALDAGHVAGATLDVFHDEPLPAAHRYWRHPKVLLTPHVSALTLVAESVAQVADKILHLERGEPITGIVDRARGY